MQIYSFLHIFLFIKSSLSVQQLVACPTSPENVFNLCFYNGSNLVTTTYGGTYGNGYGVVLRVNTNEYNIKSTSEQHEDVKIDTFMINVSEQVEICHEIENKGQFQKTISVAIHADTKINENDRVPIFRVDPMKGFHFADSGYGINILFLHSHEGHEAIDSMWYGFFTVRANYLWKNATTPNYTEGDSGIAFSWQNYTLNPGEKVNFKTAFSADPDFDFSITPTFFPTKFFTETFDDSNKIDAIQVVPTHTNKKNRSITIMIVGIVCGIVVVIAIVVVVIVVLLVKRKKAKSDKEGTSGNPEVIENKSAKKSEVSSSGGGNGDNERDVNFWL